MRTLKLGESDRGGAKYQGQMASEPSYDFLREADTKIEKLLEQLGTFEFHGYFRSGYGPNGVGGGQVAFGGPGLKQNTGWEMKPKPTRQHPNSEEMGAYEQVLGDAMAGDVTLFAREDYAEEVWRIADPQKKGTRFSVRPKKLGPDEVERVTPMGGWHNPILYQEMPAAKIHAA